MAFRYSDGMKSLALGLARTVAKPAVDGPVRKFTPKVVPDPKPITGDTVSVGLGFLKFKAPTDVVLPVVQGASEGLGVAAGTLTGAAVTAAATLCYPAAAAGVGITTAVMCMQADVDGDTALVRGAKRVALAAALAPAAAIVAPAILGAGAAVVTEEAVTQGAQWGIHQYLLSEAKSA